MTIVYHSNINSEDSIPIAVSALVAKTFWSRFRGLMFRRSFKPMDALIFHNCGAIHTYFMRFSIDVVCLDSSCRVSALGESIRPGRIFAPTRRTKTVVELPEWTIKNSHISVGDKVDFVENNV